MWMIQAVDFTLAAQVLRLFALSHHEESQVLFFSFATPRSHCPIFNSVCQKESYREAAM